MANFHPTEAALEGFRFSREHPVGLAIWTVVLFAASFAASYLAIRTGLVPASTALRDILESTQPDPAQFAAALQKVIAPIAISLAPIFAAQLVIQAAVLRGVLRPGVRGGYLRLGVDEVMLVLATIATLVLSVVCLMAVFALATIAVMVSPSIGSLMAFLGSAVTVIIIGVRLYLLIPQAITERRLDIAGAWRQTEGRFWSIFAAQLMAFAFAIVVILLGSVVAYVLRTVGGLEVENPKATINAMLAPAEIGASVVEALLQTLGLILTTAPAAAIYRALKLGGQVADAF